MKIEFSSFISYRGNSIPLKASMGFQLCKLYWQPTDWNVRWPKLVIDGLIDVMWSKREHSFSRAYNVFWKVINDLLAEKGLYFIKVHHRHDEMMMMMEIIYFEKIKFSQQCEKSFHSQTYWRWMELDSTDENLIMKLLKSGREKWIWVEKFYEKFCKINFQNNFHTFL